MTNNEISKSGLEPKDLIIQGRNFSRIFEQSGQIGTTVAAMTQDRGYYATKGENGQLVILPTDKTDVKEKKHLDIT